MANQEADCFIFSLLQTEGAAGRAESIQGWQQPISPPRETDTYLGTLVLLDALSDSRHQ